MRRHRLLVGVSGTVAVVVAVGMLGLALGPAALRTLTGPAPIEPARIARWTPLLSSAAVEPALPEPPVPGSPADVAELAAVRAAQAAGGADLAWASQPVERWNAYLLEVIRKEKPNPVRASRALALLNAALHDATIATEAAKARAARPPPAARDTGVTALVPPEAGSSYPSLTAALGRAAGGILTVLYPLRTDEIGANVGESLAAPVAAGIGTGSDVAAGAAIGDAVAAQAVERARTDGSAPPAVVTAPALVLPEFEGAWRPQIAGQPPVEPRAGSWRPWLMASADAVRPPAPPAYGSPEWERDAQELVDTMADMTPAELEIARYWADGGGTDTPPGHWTRIALELLERDSTPTPLAARTLAYLSIAQADAFIACWDAKYTYWTGRPFQLIPNFASAIVTPNFPSFPSGHSTQSAAAATVLARFFPGDAEHLRSMAEEAAYSRLLGGIHYRFDNEVGLAMGDQIGALALARLDADGSATGR